MPRLPGQNRRFSLPGKFLGIYRSEVTVLTVSDYSIDFCQQKQQKGGGVVVWVWFLFVLLFSCGVFLLICFFGGGCGVFCWLFLVTVLFWFDFIFVSYDTSITEQFKSLNYKNIQEGKHW